MGRSLVMCYAPFHTACPGNRSLDRLLSPQLNSPRSANTGRFDAIRVQIQGFKDREYKRIERKFYPPPAVEMEQREIPVFISECSWSLAGEICPPISLLMSSLNASKAHCLVKSSRWRRDRTISSCPCAAAGAKEVRPESLSLAVAETLFARR